MRYLHSIRGETLELGEILLGMDNHKSQQTPLCRAYMEAMDMVPIYTPENCTDCVSPCDRNVGQELKRRIAELFDAHYEKYEAFWDNDVTCRQKRMLVAQWVAIVWKEVRLGVKGREMIRNSFVKCGFAVAMDGSENNLIELQGYTGISQRSAGYSF